MLEAFKCRTGWFIWWNNHLCCLGKPPHLPWWTVWGLCSSCSDRPFPLLALLGTAVAGSLLAVVIYSALEGLFGLTHQVALSWAFPGRKARYRAHSNLLKIVRSEKLTWVSSYPLLLCPSPLVLFCSTASKPGKRRNGVGREEAPAPPRISECKPPTSSRKQAQREVYSWVWMTVNGGPLLGGSHILTGHLSLKKVMKYASWSIS